MSGHSASGACRADDFAWQFIKGCIETGAAPDLERIVDMTPVDFISRAIVHLAQNPDTLGQNFHLVNKRPSSLPNIVQWAASMGYDIETLPYIPWRDKLLQFAAFHPGSAAFALAPFLPEAADDLQTGTIDFDTSWTETNLQHTDITCPPIEESLFKTYLTYFKETEFLP